MHSITLIDYIITDLNSNKLKNKILKFIPPIITDPLAAFLISEKKLIDKT